MINPRLNPEDGPADDLYGNRDTDTENFPTTIGGPGGKATLTENDEKGILEEIVFDAMSVYKHAELNFSHDSHRQGIYRQDGGKYGD